MVFSEKIINWYLKNQRTLPWRNTRDPYKIWISEIIFQQTRIDQGLDYYNRFIKKFPDIKSLARANEETVLKLWQGLGYYSRARNLHFTAIHIYNNASGVFPDNFSDLKKLKGVGDYTAAAIASISFGQPVAVVDGNVFRVLSRIFGIKSITGTEKSKNEFRALSEKLMEKSDPGTYNQAIMEFGALYCKPANPDCKNCIFSSECFAFKNDCIDELPSKNTKKDVRIRYFNYLYINDAGETIVKKRTGNDIWKNLYDFPLIETDYESEPDKIIEAGKSLFRGLKYHCLLFEMKHKLTHQLLICRFLKCSPGQYYSLPEKYIKISPDELIKLPVPRIIDEFIQKHC